MLHWLIIFVYLNVCMRLSAVTGTYDVGTGIVFMLFDTVLYTLLGWYLEQVLPREYGVPRHPLFFFKAR